MKPYSESCEQNRIPILEVLNKELVNAGSLLEIGSGTGQHAVYFAPHFPKLYWQTSDLDEHHAGINAWIGASQIENVSAPLSIDVRTARVAVDGYDAAYSSNTAHIMGIDAVEKMYSLVGNALRVGGVFCLYGPFRRNGQFNTQSNADFDTNLRGRDPAMGIRDLEALDEFAAVNSLRRRRLYAVPSNNYVAVWRKTGDPIT